MNARCPSAPTPTLVGVSDALAAFGRAHPQIERIKVFGSVARHEAAPTSDVDVVVQFAPGSLPRGLAGFAFLDDLEGELSQELGFPVNLITTGSLQTASRIGNHSLPRAVARDGHLVYALESAAN